ncbi:MAG: hypothetical protein H6518_05460 [Microthrixaceae bacterium]|nr:hypothetical protein [Microthrixaceae bacterium]
MFEDGRLELICVRRRRCRWRRTRTLLPDLPVQCHDAVSVAAGSAAREASANMTSSPAAADLIESLCFASPARPGATVNPISDLPPPRGRLSRSGQALTFRLWSLHLEGALTSGSIPTISLARSWPRRVSALALPMRSAALLALLISSFEDHITPARWLFGTRTPYYPARTDATIAAIARGMGQRYDVGPVDRGRWCPFTVGGITIAHRADVRQSATWSRFLDPVPFHHRGVGQKYRVAGTPFHMPTWRPSANPITRCCSPVRAFCRRGATVSRLGF